MNTLNKAILPAAALLITSVSLAPADPKTPANHPADTASLRRLTDTAMQRIVQGDEPGAFSLFRAHWPIPPREIDLAEQRVAGFRRAKTNRFGRPLGFEYVTTQQRGQSLLRIIYIEKFENHATRVDFTFYKPQQQWLVNAINYTDDVTSLFDLPLDPPQ